MLSKRVPFFFFVFAASIILLMTSRTVFAASNPPKTVVNVNDISEGSGDLHLEYDKAYVIKLTDEENAPELKFDKLNTQVNNVVYLQFVETNQDTLRTTLGIYLTDGVSSPEASVTKGEPESTFETDDARSPLTSGLMGVSAIDWGSLSLIDTEDGTPDTGAYMTVRLWVEEYKEEEPAVVAPVKKKNPMTVKGKTAKIKYSKVRKKAQSLKIKKVLTIKKAKGKVTYTKISGNKKIVINKNTGKITVKKGLKKKTYKVKVRVKAAGDDNFKAITKTVGFKIKIK